MNKEEFLKYIANISYNMLFGAKKHFATYDIVTKVPNWISLIGLMFAILGLTMDIFSTKMFSSVIVIISVSQLYILFYNDNISLYKDVGEKLTQCFNAMHMIYKEVKSCSSEDFKVKYSAWKQQVENIEQDFYKNSIAKQIFFSDIYAHYKLFGQVAHNIDWMNEQIKFTLWKNKIPSSVKLFIKALIMIVIVFILVNLIKCPIKSFVLYVINYCWNIK